MASLEKRNGIYHAVYRFGGKKSSRSLRTRSAREGVAWEAIESLDDQERSQHASSDVEMGRTYGNDDEVSINTRTPLSQNGRKAPIPDVLGDRT